MTFPVDRMMQAHLLSQKGDKPMTIVSGTLYLVSGADKSTTLTVSLDDSPRVLQHRALLIASLYQCGYRPTQGGSSVTFILSRTQVAIGSGIGRAIDAIGRALGGVSYSFHLSDFQGQPGGSTDGNGEYERFRFRATGRAVGVRGEGCEVEEVDVDSAVADYLETECG